MAEVPFEKVAPALWPRGDDGATYAILDGARDPAVHPMVLRSRLPARCLYIGDLHPDLAAAAPWLVQLPKAEPATRALFERAWGSAWGVFVQSSVGMAALHRHCRTLLRVEDERRKRMLFRYYDPRVLRVYLPTCTVSELHLFFGPVERYVVEGEEPDRILEFCRRNRKLSQTETRVERRLAWLGDYLRKGRSDDPTGP